MNLDQLVAASLTAPKTRLSELEDYAKSLEDRLVETRDELVKERRKVEDENRSTDRVHDLSERLLEEVDDYTCGRVITTTEIVKAIARLAEIYGESRDIPVTATIIGADDDCCGDPDNCDYNYDPDVSFGWYG